MSKRSAVFTSSVGSKVIMAITGVGLVLFVVIHMAGNLQMFIGQEAMNAYGVTLRKMPLLLWAARLGLIGIALTHVIMSIRLKLQNRAARPVAYVSKNTVQATLASRTMVLTGLIVLAFAVYHLLHFTFGVTDPRHFHFTDAQGRHDIYNMVVYGFQNVFVSGGYIFAMVLLFAHLSHGAASWVQSLGLNHPGLDRIVKKAAPALTWLVCLGFVSVPLGVLLGLLKPV